MSFLNKTLVNSLMVLFLFSNLMQNVRTRDSITTFYKFYDSGMDAYKQQKWDSCISFFNESIQDYKLYRNTVIECRLQCQESRKMVENISFEDMLFGILTDSKCLRKCKKQKLGIIPEEEVSKSYEKKIQKRQPYNYLQYCYFKNGNTQMAAATAYTYYITHPEDERILETLNYYKELPEIEEMDFQDLERKPYQKAYIEALMAYNEEDWDDAAAKFELSLTEYFKEEERCRTYCETGFVHTRFPDFINAIADHYVMVIVCQQKCLQTLSTFGVDEIENFVSEHYNYLQFSYYQAKNFKKAFESIASYLLFRPQDSEMLNNKEFYMKTLGHTEDDFVPSKVAMEYVELWKKLDKSISYIRDQYILPNDLVEQNEDKEQGSDDEEDVDGQTVKTVHDTADEPKHYMARFEKYGVVLFAESEELGGEGRFVADNLIRIDQCQCLADPAKEMKPDEFGIKAVGLSEITELVQEDGDYEISLRLLMRAVNVMSIYTQAYFNKSGLYVKLVKVVCFPSEGDRLPDECVLQEDGTCSNTLNHGVYRSVAYLSDVSDGTGQLYFMDKDKNIQGKHVSPKCGRLLGFRGEDQHGVNLSWKKERCAIIVDISENEDDLSIDLFRTKQFLKELQESREVSEEEVDNSDILNQFYSQGITISKTGADLEGKERFVADGLSTESECDELVQLAKSKSRSGHGYSGITSPHTDREIFSGLDITVAEQRGAIKGDGYEDPSDSAGGSRFISPYTTSEKFEGLNISRSIEMVNLNLLPARSLHLLMDISEHGRLLTEKYFNLTRPLFFDFTHLVCRTAVADEEGETEKEQDLSHPVHADNCIIQPNGSCIADSTTFKQRHYSAVLYLNDAFEGGEFFFAHKNQSEHVSVEPKCGRLVAFNAGDYHGVRAVRQGQRCAIAMWYTHDPNHAEVSRINARKRLDQRSTRDSELDSDTVINKLKEKILKPEVLNTDIEKEHDEL